MTKLKIMILLLVLVVVLVISGCGGRENAKAGMQADEAKIKVAFVYVSTVGDIGWSYTHEQGRLFLEQQLPYVTTTKVEMVPEDAAAEQVFNKLARENRIIFATSYGYGDQIMKVAEKFPEVVFLHCSGDKTAPNVGTYFGRMYQARYLTGMVAGKMTRTNTIGFVAAKPIAEVIRAINAFTLGVRSVNPHATVKVLWTKSWYDPGREKELALELLDSGADIIAQHQDSPAPMQAAENRGKYGIGYNNDMSKTAPKAVLTSAVWNWGPYYVDVVRKIKEGNWQSGRYWGPMTDGIVDIAPYGPMVPETLKMQVETKKQQFLKDEVDVFTGPIRDQYGALRLTEGQRMTDEDMLKLDWFVEGVEGTIPMR